MKKGKFLLMALVLLAILFTFSGCNSKAADYRSDLQDVADGILENTSETEGILNEYSSVWKFSIENRSPIPIVEMAEHTGLSKDDVIEVFDINAAGNVPNDFSTNIHSLKSYYESNGEIDEIKERSDEIKGKVADLSDPPKGYEKAYDEILDMYDLSERYTEMALNPNGSLQSFNEEKNEISSDIVSKRKRIEVIIPSE